MPFAVQVQARKVHSCRSIRMHLSCFPFPIMAARCRFSWERAQVGLSLSPQSRFQSVKWNGTISTTPTAGNRNLRNDFMVMKMSTPNEKSWNHQGDFQNQGDIK